MVSEKRARVHMAIGKKNRAPQPNYYNFADLDHPTKNAM